MKTILRSLENSGRYGEVGVSGGAGGAKPQSYSRMHSKRGNHLYHLCHRVNERGVGGMSLN